MTKQAIDWGAVRGISVGCLLGATLWCLIGVAVYATAVYLDSVG